MRRGAVRCGVARGDAERRGVAYTTHPDPAPTTTRRPITIAPQNGRDLSAALGSVGEDEAADNAEVPIPQGSPQPDIEMTISKSKTVGDLPSNSSTQFAPRKSGIGSMTAMIRQG